jgi:primosomal protein N' (replication factor Y)
LPDYRAGEQTFQLLCQVAGRAGRGFKAGKVVIQTFSPQNYAVRAAAHHDYAGFYGKEIQYRQRHGYPPFSRMVRLIYSHTNELICRREIHRLHQKFASAMKEKQIKGLSIIGPTPAYISRLRGKYRWQLFLRGDNPAAIIVDEKLSSGWIVDVDPVDIG